MCRECDLRVLYDEGRTQYGKTASKEVCLIGCGGAGADGARYSYNLGKLSVGR